MEWIEGSIRYIALLAACGVGVAAMIGGLYEALLLIMKVLPNKKGINK